MKILFIAPLPPPISGQSIAVKALHDSLVNEHTLEVVNINKKKLVNGFDGFERVFEVISLLYNVLKKRKSCDVIYLTISESFLGNIKDLLIYSICYKKLGKMYVHLHGGSLRRNLLDKNKILYKLNKFFLRRLGGVIVLGNSHISIFEDIIEPSKIYIVPNYSEESLFISNEVIKEKFGNSQPIKIIFLSNLIQGKGADLLLESYLELDNIYLSNSYLEFAGAFESEGQKALFLDKIAKHKRVKYHGILVGVEKQKFLKNAHVFCLPTALFEGQPISILEAYASGCVVITTAKSGILDIFEENKNGYIVSDSSVEILMKALEKVIANRRNLVNMALNNNNYARNQFRIEKYINSMHEILLR